MSPTYVVSGGENCGASPPTDTGRYVNVRGRASARWVVSSPVAK